VNQIFHKKTKELQEVCMFKEWGTT